VTAPPAAPSTSAPPPSQASVATAPSGAGEAPRLAELLGSLTLAADLVNGFPPEKVLRTAVLAVRLGACAGLSAEVQRDAYFLTLFRFLGCTAFAHEEAHRYGAGDDITVRNVMALADISEPAPTLRSIIGRIGRGASWSERARAVVRLLAPEAIVEHAHAQCDVSRELARLVGMSESVIEAIGQVCERHDGKGAPSGVGGAGLLPASKLLHLCDAAEIAQHRHGDEAALALVQRRSGKQLDPALCRAFARHGRELLGGLGGSTWQSFLAAEPMPCPATAEQPVRVALAFARFVDIKSVYTLDHSARVAALATRAAALAGLPPDAIDTLGLAAHLHDLGRVSVPTGIWDKPGPLDVHEQERVRLHAYYTERILARGRGWTGAARVAAAAHERLDGEGYHRSLPGSALGSSERLLAAADVLAALLSTRPHRPAHQPAAARDLLRAEASAGRLDSHAVDAVIAAHEGTAIAPRRAPAPRGLTERELEVLRLIALGKSNQETAQLLGISPKTVKNHVAHVYDKIGVYSRAGAALFVAEQGLS
jgi:HD-GYP domain-containing protein (c-di-GMP phosphodiesterase class II)